MNGRVLVGGSLVLAMMGMAACADDPAAVEEEVVLLSVQPAGGSVDVAITSSVVITFDHAIMPAMTSYAALHEGDISGPEVAGAWSLAPDGRVLTFEPAAPLEAGTGYTIHLGGGMEGAHGGATDFETHGSAHMGGTWVSGGMMGGGMGGMGGAHPHMGSGWEHANGSFGMIFTFTTAD
ncbi:MAG: Ig-like domain-containing protein [Gemmatimonadota bacterium]